jgi:uncharacterized protein (TIRG00374 family)
MRCQPADGRRVSRRLRAAWPILRWLLGLCLAAVAVWVVAGQRGELLGAGRALSRIEWWWVVVAVGSESVSYLSFAAMQRVLLGCGEVRARRRRLVGISLASTSMQNSLPAGTAFAAAYVFRQYRRLGADDVLAAWTVIAFTALSFITIAGLAGTGLVLAFSTGSALDLVQVIGGTAGVAALVVLAWLRRSWILSHSVRAVRVCQRLVHRPRGDAAEHVARVRARVGAVAPDRRNWLLAGAFAAGNWVFDLGCLALAFAAVDASLPWRGLLLAYAAAQLAAILPITPGGLGVVEGSLTIALVAFGGAEGTAIAAVLVYRIISFWSELPVGWLAWGLVRRSEAVAPVPPLVALSATAEEV